MIPRARRTRCDALKAALIAACSLGTAGLVHAALIDLASEPLAQSTSSLVKPNLLFILDDSGSMGWEHMPDAVEAFQNRYGYFSNQCNSVYYDPTVTYSAPLKADKSAYPNANFTDAPDNGFDPNSAKRNLNKPPNSVLATYGAHYFLYTGQVTDKDYNRGSAFHSECSHSLVSMQPSTVFLARRLASEMTTTIELNGCSKASVASITVNGKEIMSGETASTSLCSTLASSIAEKISRAGYRASARDNIVTLSGPSSAADYTPVIRKKAGYLVYKTNVFPSTDPAKLTNFANWYSYHRTRMLMMKTATGQAFAQVDSGYRVGLMIINTRGAPALGNDTFSGSHREAWYRKLYATTPTNWTPLRAALADAGRYYAGQLSSASSADPVQHSCQQNFTLLSTDGVWNGPAGTMMDGKTKVGNQDRSAPRPMNDGTTHMRNARIYQRDAHSIDGQCKNGLKRKKTQAQRQACHPAAGGRESCTDWYDFGEATYESCQRSVVLPAPNPSVQARVTDPTWMPGANDTLADVAMYYYQTDLRTPALENCGTVSARDPEGLCKNNVFAGSNDANAQQHMTTFTLGLGVSGRMKYDPGYQNGGSADFNSILLGPVADKSARPPVCAWQPSSTICNWPAPGEGKSDENIDDLWHAAVNGRGTYFSATDPNSLAKGLSGALAGIAARKGSASSAATSTLAPVAGNNFAYLASYTTALWKGNLEARGVNIDTGAINANAAWCAESVTTDACNAPGTVVVETAGATQTAYCRTPNASACPNGTIDADNNCNVSVAIACQGTMNGRISTSTDTRVVKTAGKTRTGIELVDFDAAFAEKNPSPFAENAISQLSQWALLDGEQRRKAAGANLVKFLRGQTQYEDRASNAIGDRLFRKREAVLGDITESQPVYVGAPNFSYPDAGYTSFKTNQADRPGTVYLGANDGMLHAFNASDGKERWAYVPSAVVPNLWRLADKNYTARHRNFVNGSPVISDVCTANCSCDADCVRNGGSAPIWKTILVGGLNGGGQGYYALDVTNPASPALLWELTTSKGQGSTRDDDLGYSFGPAQITRKADGTWVVLVTSGYNNVGPGKTGLGYLYVLNAASGAIISKIATTAGSKATPGGLARIAVWNDEPAGNQAGYVYGGDLLGNVWRFDINGTSNADIGTGSVMKFAELYADQAGTKAQPIMTTPVLGKIANKRVIFINTGRYLETSDLTTSQTQSQYAIKDDDASDTFVNPRTTLVRQTLELASGSDGGKRYASRREVNFYTGRGWYFDFPDSGERANVDAQLILGTLIIPSIVPTNTVCEPGGYGWLTYVDYLTGGALAENNLASYRYSSPPVGFNVLYIQGTPQVSVIPAGGYPQRTPEIPFAASKAGFSGTRALWREITR